MTRLEKNQLDFINLRFGTFLHFNSASVQFASSEVEDWEFGCENCGEPRRWPFDESTWAPRALDTDAWAAVAKSAGCRFAALTAKHHEGFCLWPTEMTGHSVKNAAVQTDVVERYLDSFRRAGIAAGLYFSILDLTQGIRRNFPFREEEYAFVEGQITELLTRYGEIPFLIVDGWNAPWGGPDYAALPFARLDALVKSLQPDCLLLNIGGSDTLAGSDVVFFENAAGQEAGADFQGPGVSCNKLTEAWFYRTSEKTTPPKSAVWARGKAEDCFRKNINFMLNLSPDADGRIDAGLAAAFAEIGRTLALPAPLTSLPEGWMRRAEGEKNRF